MKKKVIKKKAAAAPISKPSDDLEMPMSTRMDDADDVAEDHEIFDMSNIAAPVIEFEMPNLKEREFDKVAVEEPEAPTEKPSKATKKPAKVAKKATKTEVSGQKTQLTAEKLNNELVGLRAIVVKSKNQLMSKLVRQKKELEAKLKKEETKGKEEMEKKVGRIVEEVLGLKTIDKDTIAKFAALNTKTLNELKINGKTPVAERLMYKLACQEVVVEKVQAVKEKYIEWSKTAAFFMQRLGQQYANKPEKSAKKAIKTTKKEEQEMEEEDEDVEDSSTPEGSPDNSGDDDGDEEEEEGESGDGEDYNQSDVEMVDSDEEEGADAARKRRSLLLGLIGVKEDNSRPALKPKKRKIEDEDVETVSAAGHKKTKEDVKKEMKEVLEKELKTKEIQNPKQSNPKGKKATTAAPKKTVKAEVKKRESDDEEDEKEEQKVELEDPNQKTLIMKVDLSKGGKIAKTPKSALIPSATKPVKKDEEDDEDDESASFFLPKSSSAKAPPTKRKPIVKAMEKLEVTDQKGKQEKGAAKKKSSAPTPASKPIPSGSEKKKGSSKNQTELGEMHPSWVASQLKKKELAAAKPCGKKMTFADSDDE